MYENHERYVKLTSLIAEQIFVDSKSGFYWSVGVDFPHDGFFVALH